MTREETIRRIKAWNLDSDDMEVLTVVIPELAESEEKQSMTRKEAIDKVFGMIGTAEQHEALEFLVPEVRELRESYDNQQEDEKIRKEIISALKFANDGGVYNKHIAYLENQKPSFKQIHDGVIWHSGLRAGIELEKQQEQKRITNGWKGEDLERYLSCLQRLGTGNPQQPETINSKWFKEHCCPQPKQEWSYPYGSNETADRLVALAECLEMDGDCQFNGYSGTECGKFLRELARKQVECKSEKWNDSVTKEMFIKALERAVDQTKKGYELTDCDKHSWWEDFKTYSEIKLIEIEWSAEDSIHLTNAILSAQKEWGSESYTANWLKSLPERFNLQPKQEWSEEDKAMLKVAIAVLRRYNHDDVANFLKSLRPSWKPTKDQIEVLKWCKPLFYEPNCKKILESLIDDLEKLLGLKARKEVTK